MKRIILDTSFLMVPFQFGVDIISDIKRVADFRYKLFIVDKTQDELEHIIEVQTGKNRDAARFAMTILKKEDITILPTENKTHKNVDSLIVDLVDEDDDIVATQDKELKRRLREKHVRIIELRQKSHLKID